MGLTTLTAQNDVKFENNQMYVRSWNGSSWSSWSHFVPLGWYGASRLSGGNTIRDQQAVEQSIDDLVASGGNILMMYYNAILDAYGDGTPDYESSTEYRIALLDFLDHLHTESGGLVKTFVTLPPRSAVNGDLLTNNAGLDWVSEVLTSAVINHPAVVGIYTADEPEVTPSGQPAITYAHMLARYEAIKDQYNNYGMGNQPQVVVFAGVCQFVQNFTSRSFSGCSNNVSGYNGRIFDILMVDTYPVTTMSTRTFPHPDIWQLRYPLEELVRTFDHEVSNDDEGMIMFVAQGSGELDISGSSNGFGTINQSYEEMHFTFLKSLQHTYDDTRGISLGGYLYWAYDYADATMRTRMKDYLTFIDETGVFNTAHYSTNFDANVTISEGWPFYSRSWIKGNELYIISLNDQDSITLESRNDVDVTATVSSSSLEYVHELTPPALGGDTWNRIWTETDQFGNDITIVDYITDHQDYEPYQGRLFRFTFDSTISSFTDSNPVTGTIGLFDEIEIDSSIEVKFQSYPNPFNNATVLNFDAPNNSSYQVNVFDMLGRVVLTSRGITNSNTTFINLNAQNLASGVYVAQLVVDIEGSPVIKRINLSLIK